MDDSGFLLGSPMDGGNMENIVRGVAFGGIIMVYLCFDILSVDMS